MEDDDRKKTATELFLDTYTDTFERLDGRFLLDWVGEWRICLSDFVFLLALDMVGVHLSM